MRDITSIDWNAPYQRIVDEDVQNQKVFYIQNEIEYDAGGKACNAKQVKAHYAAVAAEAQKQADEAKEAAAEAQKAADDMLKQAGVTKTAARKAAAG